MFWQVDWQSTYSLAMAFELAKNRYMESINYSNNQFRGQIIVDEQELLIIYVCRKITNPFNFFLQSSWRESICYCERAKRLKNESNTTGALRKIWMGNWEGSIASRGKLVHVKVPSIDGVLGQLYSGQLRVYWGINGCCGESWKFFS